MEAIPATCASSSPADVVEEKVNEEAVAEAVGAETVEDVAPTPSDVVEGEAKEEAVAVTDAVAGEASDDVAPAPADVVEDKAQDEGVAALHQKEKRKGYKQQKSKQMPPCGRALLTPQKQKKQQKAHGEKASKRENGRRVLPPSVGKLARRVKIRARDHEREQRDKEIGQRRIDRAKLGINANPTGGIPHGVEEVHKQVVRSQEEDINKSRLSAHNIKNEVDREA